MTLKRINDISLGSIKNEVKENYRMCVESIKPDSGLSGTIKIEHEFLYRSMPCKVFFNQLSAIRGGVMYANMHEDDLDMDKFKSFKYVTIKSNVCNCPCTSVGDFPELLFSESSYCPCTSVVFESVSKDDKPDIASALLYLPNMNVREGSKLFTQLKLHYNYLEKQVPNTATIKTVDYIEEKLRELVDLFCI